MFHLFVAGRPAERRLGDLSSAGGHGGGPIGNPAGLAATRGRANQNPIGPRGGWRGGLRLSLIIVCRRLCFFCILCPGPFWDLSGTSINCLYRRGVDKQILKNTFHLDETPIRDLRDLWDLRDLPGPSGTFRDLDTKYKKYKQ